VTYTNTVLKLRSTTNTLIIMAHPIAVMILTQNMRITPSFLMYSYCSRHFPTLPALQSFPQRPRRVADAFEPTRRLHPVPMATTRRASRFPFPVAAATLLLVLLLAGGGAADDASSDDDAGGPRTPGCSNKFQLVTACSPPVLSRFALPF